VYRGGGDLLLAGNDMRGDPMDWVDFGADLLERAGWSAGQVFFSTLLTGGTAVTFANLPWHYALTLALSAGVASAVLTLAQYAAKLTDLPFWADLLARLVKTFLASLAASFAAAHPFDVASFHWSAALNLAGVAVLSCVAKGFLAHSAGAAAPSAEAGPGAARLQRAASSPSTLSARRYIAAALRQPG
jgi:hypothetical protein